MPASSHPCCLHRPCQRRDRGRDWPACLRQVLLWALCLAWAPPVWAIPGVAAGAWLADPQSRLTPAGLAHATGWQALPDVLSLGYQPHPVWLRLQLQPTAPGVPLQLRMRPAFVDDVRLYLPRPGGGFTEQRSGDRVPWVQRPGSDTALVFGWTPEPACSADCHTVWLRLQSTSTLTAQLAVLEPAQALQQRDAEQLLIGGFLGLMAAVFAWSLWQAVQRRDLVLAWFSAYQGLSLLMSVGLLGVAARWLFPGSDGADSFTSLMVLGVSVAGALFHRALLLSLGLHRWAVWLMNAALVPGLVNLALWAGGQVQWALRLNAITVLLVCAVLLPLVGLSVRQAQPLRRWLLLAYGVLALTIVLSMLPLLGWLSHGPWAVHQTSLHGLLTGLVLAMLLVQRQQQLDAQARRTTGALQAARAHADDTRQFLAMLTHEMRTPLAVLRLSLDQDEPPASARARAERCIADIDRLVDRATLAQQMLAPDLQPQLVDCALPALLARLCAETSQPERFVLDGPADLPMLRTDADWLAMALTHLLDNALKYAAPDTPLQLHYGVPPGVGAGLLVSVANAPGQAGWPDAQQLFRKYYRSPAARQLRGNGLGLYLAASLVQRLGGHLVYRPDGQLVRFELWMPR